MLERTDNRLAGPASGNQDSGDAGPRLAGAEPATARAHVDRVVGGRAGAEDLRPDLLVVLVGTAAVALVSGLTLPSPLATVSTILGALMIAGADVDARTCLLPDLVTFGALAGGIAVQPLLDPFEPVWSGAEAVARAAATAGALALVRWGYASARHREGIGLGDVKLAAAVGAWLPCQMIPYCFALATGGALVAVAIARLRGEPVDAITKVPFGAFLAPSLWIAFYAVALLG